MQADAKFIVPDWGDKVNSGLSYRAARLLVHGLAGPYDNPMPESTMSPQRGTMNLATDKGKNRCIETGSKYL